MNEPREMTEGTMPDGQASDERLRTLLQAAYPGAEPDEALDRSVAELVARHARPAARQRRWWWPTFAVRLGRGSSVQAAGSCRSAALARLRASQGTDAAQARHSRHISFLFLSSRLGLVAAAALLIALGLAVVRRDHRGAMKFSPQEVFRPGFGPKLRPERVERISQRQQAPPVIPSRTTPVDDTAFVSPAPVPLMQRWAPLPQDEWQEIEDRVRRSVRVQDDFVRIPFPLLAATSGRQVVAAVESYKREAAVIDPRLFRKVTLALKGASLEDVCAALQAQTGVEMRAARSVADDKATVFVNDRPAREVMRGIVQVFGFSWLRSKKESGYRYELLQDLRSQLAEEELRNRDMGAALLSLDREMQAYRPYLDLTLGELQRRYAQARDAERSRLQRVVHGAGWAGVQLYYRLTLAQRASLITGAKLVFSPGSRNPELRLPEEWVQPILRWSGDVERPQGGTIPLADIPGVALTSISLECDRAELGKITMSVRANTSHPGGDTEFLMRLADGQSPSVEKPGNAAANGDLRDAKPLQRPVSVRPESSCPKLRVRKAGPGDRAVPHVFSADVWEAIHRATGQDIVADFYTRVYPTTQVTVDQVPLFDALCRVGDAMSVRWRMESGLLLGRSTSFFWDRLKEVPNRYLVRWQQEKGENGALPLDSLIEMASLSDDQLNAGKEGSAITHCWGLDEWHIVATVPDYEAPTDGARISPYPPRVEVRYYELTRASGADKPAYLLKRVFLDPGNLRSELRFFGTLTVEQRQRALQPNGISLAGLNPEQQRDFLQICNSVEELRERRLGHHFGPDSKQLLNARFSAEYIPAGWYYWSAPWREPRAWERVRPRFAGRTGAEALAAARRSYPEAQPAEINHSPGGEFAPAIWIGPLSAQEIGGRPQ